MVRWIRPVPTRKVGKLGTFRSGSSLATNRCRKLNWMVPVGATHPPEILGGRSSRDWAQSGPPAAVAQSNRARSRVTCDAQTWIAPVGGSDDTLAAWSVVRQGYAFLDEESWFTNNIPFYCLPASWPRVWPALQTRARPLRAGVPRL